jgi:phage N-6-adenine-methyltransferase
MNHYAIKLEEIKAKPTHQLKEVGDQWQTPKSIAWGLFSTFSARIGSFVIDIFADDCNHLLPNYYTAEQNALSQDLAADIKKLGGSAAFANPPYSRPCFDDEQAITGMIHILKWCREQRENGAKIMLLIKAATSETWWPEDADFIQFIEGRIKFEAPNWFNPATYRDKPSSSGFASAIVIFDKQWQWEPRPKERLCRDDLIATGNALLTMAVKEAA